MQLQGPRRRRALVHAGFVHEAPSFWALPVLAQVVVTGGLLGRGRAQEHEAPIKAEIAERLQDLKALDRLEKDDS